MDNDLTKEEEQLIIQFELIGKWETLVYELSLLAPFAIIIILSAVHDSKLGIIIGLGVYTTFRLWAVFRQCASVPIMKSAIKKLRKNTTNKNTVNPDSQETDRN